MSLLLVTKNRYDALKRAHRMLKVQKRELEEHANELYAELVEANKQREMRERDLQLAVEVIQNDEPRRRAMRVVNSEVIVWTIGPDGEPQPPVLRDTIVGMWTRYSGIRPEDLGDLLPGMVGISVLPRTGTGAMDALSAVQDTTIDRETIVVAEAKELTPHGSEANGHATDHGDGTGTGHEGS